METKYANLLDCWHSGFRNELMGRIKGNKPCLVINLSTNPIKNDVDILLTQYGFKHLNGIHPSGWNRTKKKNPSSMLIY